MKIDVIGCGSAFSQTHNTSAMLVDDTTGGRWLIDCGPTIPRALWQRKLDINAIDVMYFTHIHPDHCAGLPALVNQWKSFGRTEPLLIYCQPEQQPVLMSLLALASWPKNELGFAVHWQPITDAFTWRHWQIQTACTQHEVTNRALRIDVDEQALFYSGDGRPTANTQELMKGCTLAFQECASFDPLPTTASHGDLPGCQALLSTINIPALGLYHCFDEHKAALNTAVATIDGLFLSEDGLTIDLANTNRIQALSQGQTDD